MDENYFPLFVSASVLEKEKDHVQGFAPEVCVYTFTLKILLTFGCVFLTNLGCYVNLF